MASGNRPRTVPPSVRIVASSPPQRNWRTVPRVLKMKNQPLAIDHSIEESDELPWRNTAAEHFVELAAQPKRFGPMGLDGKGANRSRHQSSAKNPLDVTI